MQLEKQFDITTSEDDGDTKNTVYVMTRKAMILK